MAQPESPWPSPTAGSARPLVAWAMGSLVKPAAQEGSRGGNVPKVYAQVRELILQGEIPPGASLNQVELAKALGVSRTPVREAMRMLHREGLVSMTHNQRATVAEFEPGDLDAIYAARIVMESVATMVSAPLLSMQDWEALGGLVDAMSGAAADADAPAWERLHYSYHMGVVGKVGKPLLGSIGDLNALSERYRRLLFDRRGGSKADVEWEHREVVRAGQSGDYGRAAKVIARHLAHTALVVMAVMAPEVEPAAVRSALRMVVGSDVSPAGVDRTITLATPASTGRRARVSRV